MKTFRYETLCNNIDSAMNTTRDTIIDALKETIDEYGQMEIDVDTVHMDEGCVILSNYKKIKVETGLMVYGSHVNMAEDEKYWDWDDVSILTTDELLEIWKGVHRKIGTGNDDRRKTFEILVITREGISKWGSDVRHTAELLEGLKQDEEFTANLHTFNNRESLEAFCDGLSVFGDMNNDIVTYTEKGDIEFLKNKLELDL